MWIGNGSNTVEHGDRRKGVLAYLGIAFGGAWAAWGAAMALAPVSPRSPLFQLAMLPGAFAPAIGALVVRRYVTREGFADAGLRLDMRRWRPYALGLLWPLIGVTTIAGLAAGLGLSEPDTTLRRALGALAPAAEMPELPRWLWLALPAQLLTTAVIATPILWGEEFGWRGYLQRRLLAERPLAAAVATGLIWGVWHYPLILAGYQYPDDRLLGLLLFPVSTVLLSIILSYIQERAGSVWAVSLAHAATNAVGGSLTSLLFFGGPNWAWVSYLGILGWVPLGALCAWIVGTGRLVAGDAGGQRPALARR